MSDRQPKQYNLHFSKQGQVHMLVHIQLCGDREFFDKSVECKSGPGANIDVKADISDSDTVVAQSNNNLNSDHSDSRIY